MSPVDSILGLSNVVVERVERNQEIHVWVRPRERPACLHCQHNAIRIKATHKRTLKHTRQGNQVMVLHLSVPKYHYSHCNRYFRHRFAGISPLLRATESYRLEVFEAHGRAAHLMGQGKLALTHTTITHHGYR